MALVPECTGIGGMNFARFPTGRDPTRGSGQEVLRISRVESGLVKRCSRSQGLRRLSYLVFKFHGSDRVTLNWPEPREVARHAKPVK